MDRELAKGVAPVAAREKEAPADAPLADDKPGLVALKALLAKGDPDPVAVIEILDAHRGERDALFGFLQTTLGNAYVARVEAAMSKLRLDTGRKEIVAGDPAAAEGGYFLASAEEKGARWRTKDGDFSGKVGKDGLDSKLRLGDATAHATVDSKWKNGSIDFKEGEASLGKITGSRDDDGWKLGASRPFQLGKDTEDKKDDATLTPELRYEESGDKSRYLGALAYKDEKTTAEAYAGGSSDGLILGGSGSHKFGSGYSLSGSVEHAGDDTKVRGTFGREWDKGKYSLTGEAGDAGSKLSLTGEGKQGGLTLGGDLAYARDAAGVENTRLALRESYQSPGLTQGLSLEATHGLKDSLKASGNIDARLLPNLYGGAFGEFSTERGGETTASGGASLTFLPAEKLALTAAGIVDQTGAFEARLQLDVLKSKVDSVAGLSEAKKKAIVSLFLSYTQGHDPGMLNDRMGSPMGTKEFGGGQGSAITGGVLFRF
jgi:hypothetical protein